jgi:hypothetical protein
MSEKGQLAAGGNHLQWSSKVIRPGGVVADTPYVANRESVAGYILITARDMNAAIQIAKKCPILNGGDKNSTGAGDGNRCLAAFLAKITDPPRGEI